MRAPAKGFSLLELIVVIAIVGLLVGSTVTGFNLFRSPRMLGLAAAQIVADLRDTQQRARTERAEYVVMFSPGSGEYGISKIEGGAAQRVRLPRGALIATTTWPEHRVTFSTYGNPDRTGVVRVRNRAGEQIVRVDELGRVTTGP